MPSVGQLVLASVLPVIQVILISCVGAFAVWKGILTSPGASSISRLIYFVLLPSLIVSSLGTSVTGADILEWWYLVVNVALNVALGLAFAAVLSPIAAVPRHLRAHYYTCASVGNLGNFPLVLVPAIAKQSSQFTDADGEAGLAYVLCGLFAVCIAAFSLGGYLLRTPHPLPDGAGTAGDTSSEPCSEQSTTSSADVTTREVSSSTLNVGVSTSWDRVASGQESSAEPGASSLPRGASNQCAAGSVELAFMPGASEESAQCQAHTSLGLTPMNGQADHESASLKCGASQDMADDADCGSPGSHQSENCRLEIGSTITDEHACVTRFPVLSLRNGAASASSASSASSLGTPLSSDGAAKSPCKSTHAVDGDAAASAADVKVQNPAARHAAVSRTCMLCWPQRLRPRQQQACDSDSVPVAAPPGCICRHVRATCTFLNGALLNAPTVAVGIGVLVALVPALNRVFFVQGDDDGSSADRPPLDVITQALQRLGGAMIPSLLLTLGASLSRGPGAAVPWPMVTVLCILRLVVLPVVGSLCVFGLRAVGFFTPPDDMFMLVLLLQHAMPTALNVYTLAAVRQNYAAEMATVSFWQYMCCMLSIPVSVGAFLALL